MRILSAATPALVLIVLSAACGQGPAPPAAIQLVDLYRAEQVRGQAAQPARKPPRTEWRFDGTEPGPHPKQLAATRGWHAATGVGGLAIRDGRLAGVATSDFPLLHLERTTGLDDGDQVHAVEIRLRVSAGANLAFHATGQETIDFGEVVEEASAFPWLDTTPIVGGDQIRTYVIRPRRPPAASQVRHLLIRPTDAEGATFEIESVRLVLRKEHLASIPSGVGWQGLSEIYRETIVSRSPETLSLDLQIPDGPWLDLGLGTIEEGPVTFLVEADGRQLLERTITTPHRWESVAVDLSPFAGRKIPLSLTLRAAEPGRLGFWGSPVIRSRGAMPAATGTAGVEPPQGVILIWADTLRRDHLSVYGYGRETSPQLRKMASEGVLFTDCVSQASWTKVATPSLLTSLHPTSHGVLDFADRLPSTAVTLAEVYREAGYATLSMSSILFTGAFTNLHQGYEELHEDRSMKDQRSSKTAREYLDRLLPWLEAHRDVPFFVFLHVSDPHDPYRPYPPYDTMWADASKSEEHERQAKDVRKFIQDPLMKQFGMPTRDELTKAGFDAYAYVAHDRDWYDGSIRAMDVEIGRLLEGVRGLGLDRRTLVVFTGDHGEEFFDHGRMFHGQSVYGELVNAPLILWRPGTLPAGTVVADTTRIIDVMPTLLQASGLPAPEGMQGESLLPLVAASLKGGADRSAGVAHAAGREGAAPRPAISEKAALNADVAGGPPPRATESYSIVLDGWKLIHNVKRDGAAPEYELYDHRADPLNQRDVAAEHPDIVARLTAELTRLRAAARAARLKPDSESAGSVSAEELERLRSLGYIQ